MLPTFTFVQDDTSAMPHLVILYTADLDAHADMTTQRAGDALAAAVKQHVARG